jgi:CheY-like chemotaxis protein
VKTGVCKTKLLVVDDEPLSIEILGKVLGDKYEILAALCGEDALKISTTCLPDLIMLDISMPGMDGYEVCRRLKEKESTRNIPVIFITALEGDEREEQGLALGANDYLPKSLNPTLLKLRIERNLKLKSQIDHLSMQVNELRCMHEKLADEMGKIRVLCGMLPICCKCKKIKDTRGCWHPLESYISEHSDVLFSHGYCPECATEALCELEYDHND